MNQAVGSHQRARGVYVAVGVYVSAIVAANMLIAHFGPWVSPINSFLLIGLDLSLRDHLHDRWRGRGLWPRMLGLIATAGVISYLLNPSTAKIALASAVAFSAAGLVNAVVYHRLTHWPFLARANTSNFPAALTDSLVFPAMAFGAWMPAVVALQFLAKVTGGGVWSAVIHYARNRR